MTSSRSRAELTPPRVPPRHRPRGLRILHEDRDLLVIEKEAGLLTMSYRRDEARTAQAILTGYLRKGNPRATHEALVVHRLDRDTSGVLLFAKTGLAKDRLKKDWKRTEKLYLAAVHGQLPQTEGTFSSYLSEDSDQFVHVVDDPAAGQLAETAYRVLKVHHGISIVRVRLITGRKNQIRVHFATAGCPVVGDLKYGKPGTTKERLALHAKSIAFHHPHHGTRMFAETAIPEFFSRIAGGLTEADWTSDS